MKPLSLIVCSLLLLALSLVTARLKGASQVLRWATTFMTVLVIMLTGFFVVANRLSGNGIDESVIYHLAVGLGGAGFGEYKGPIAASVTFILLSVVVAIVVFRWILRRTAAAPKRWGMLSAGFLVAAIMVSPASIDLAGLYLQRHAGTESVFPYVRPAVESAGSPLNVVYIYLESFERTYLDEDIFPGLTPGLKKLEGEGRSFTNVRQVYGTGWTVGGMTASQCGVPLVTAAAGNEVVGNSMSGLSRFLPGAFCIGDVLAAQGYELSYMGGASLEFAGKGGLYRTHGFQSVQGLHELLGQVEDPAYRSPWGLHDDTLFDLAADQYRRSVAAGGPFGLFLLTLGTHHPEGHVSARCSGLEYGSGDNPILNAAHCTDKLVSEYVQKVRRSDTGNNTVIVVASDHLAMPNSARSSLEKGDRKNLLLIIPPGPGAAVVVDRPASTLDIAPTLLSLLGIDVRALGYGRDLARDEATAVESLPDVNGFLASRSSYLAGFWEFPQISNGFSIDTAEQIVHMGSDSVKLPALMVLNSAMEVREIRFEFDTPLTLVKNVAELPSAQSIIWVDSCARISILDTEGEISGSNAGTCVAIGGLGSDKLAVRAVADGDAFAAKSLDRLAGNDVDPAIYALRMARLESFERYGSADVQSVRVFADEGMVGNATVVVSGGPGTSFFGAADTVSEEGAGVTVSRGLTLLAVADGEAAKLAHYDSCEPNNPVVDSSASSRPFAEHMAIARRQGYSAFFILGQDSVRCGSTSDAELERIFAGLPLEEWRSVSFRQPYLGIVSGDSRGWELLGNPGAAMVLQLAEFSAPADYSPAEGEVGVALHAGK